MLSISLPFLNLKLIIVPLEHGIEGDTRNNSKISCHLFGVLVAILQIKWIQLLWSLLIKDFVLQSYRVNNLEERQINSQGTKCLEVSRERYNQ